jgi:RND family efflux transporter MFP subunit
VTRVSNEDRLEDELANLRIQRDEPRSKKSGGAPGRGGIPGWLIALVVMIGLGVGGYFVFQKGQGELFPDEVELGAVSLMSPAQADVTLVASGYVYARKKATVAPKVTGRLAKLTVGEGDQVKEGQLIAEIEAADVHAQAAQVRADISAAKARVERARAELADAQLKLSREEDLLKRGAGTQANADDARARVSTARAQIGSAEAEVGATAARQAAIAVQLDNTKIRAPFDGTVVRKLSEIGDVLSPQAITPGQGILILQSLHDLEVWADVSESQYSKIKVGIPAEILLDAIPDKRFRGQLTEIRQQIDRAKAAVTVKVRFTDPSTGVLPDMAAKVSFLAKALDDAALKAAPKVMVPADAVVDRGGRKVVYAFDDGRAREHAINTVGTAHGGVIEIQNGPSPGTRLIRKPSDKVRDGAAVKEKKK